MDACGCEGPQDVVAAAAAAVFASASACARRAIYCSSVSLPSARISSRSF